MAKIPLTSTTGSDIEGINGIAAVPALCVLIGARLQVHGDRWA